jgi:hypothetical protein
MDDDHKENTSLFAFGGTNVKHKFNLFMQPGPWIKAVQGTLAQNYKTLCCDMYLFIYLFLFYIQ